MKVAALIDCLSMQSIPQPNLSTQVLVRHPNLDRGPNQPTKLISMQMLVALVTTLLRLHSQLDVLMFVLVTNQSSPSQMHQLCPAPLPGMIQQLGKLAFWSQMKHFIAAPNWITPQSIPTKFEVLVLIARMTPSTNPGPSLLGLSIMVSPFHLPPLEQKSSSLPEPQHLTSSCNALTFNSLQKLTGIQLKSLSAHHH